MLIPIGGFRVDEYDETLLVTPTSRFGHSSDTVLATIEMQITNDQAEEISFPFAALSTDPGTGAESDDSIEPKITNGSRQVELVADELDQEAEQLLVNGMTERAQAAGVTDAAALDAVKVWAQTVLDKAQRIKVGRTKIRPNERRRIILQQRIRVQPDDQGRLILDTIAPTPASTLAAGGRVSVVALLPWEDDDVKPQILTGDGETTQGFEFEQGRIKQRLWVAWHWKNDPVFRLAWRYG
ncbi:MAG TPA: hypothetical protein VNP96_01160 [Solirubrobacterales bacterium]|nr:hypothetical protein [Solirubrobacterales bacterium]